MWTSERNASADARRGAVGGCGQPGDSGDRRPGSAPWRQSGSPAATRLAGYGRRPISQAWWWPLALIALGVLALVAGFKLGEAYTRRHPRRTVTISAVRLRSARLPLIVERTAYSLEAAQTDATPFIARCGRITPEGVPVGGGRYRPAIAVSRDLLKVADCGARVRIDGREYVVWDTMHERWTRRVDVLVATRGEAIRQGRRRATFEVAR